METRLVSADSPLTSDSSTTPQQLKTEDTFERTEDKYLIPHMLYQPFLDMIQEHMEPSYPIPNTHYTLIESRYFDSSQLHFFQHHFQSLPLRFKLRLRRYGPNGEWQANVLHLELKAKQDKVSKKERFRISDDVLQLLFNGELLSLTPSLREDNPDTKKKRLIKRIEKVNTVIEEFTPKPVSVVRYVRRAFEQDGLRVTVDNNIRTKQLCQLHPDTVSEIRNSPTWEKMQKMGGKIQNDSHFLLEIKRNGETPEWLTQLMQSYELKDTGFSKYCYSMVGFINTFDDSTI